MGQDKDKHWKLTNKSLLLLIMTEPVATWEECIGVCLIKPWHITHIDTQPNLQHSWRGNLKATSTKIQEILHKQS